MVDVYPNTHNSAGRPFLYPNLATRAKRFLWRRQVLLNKAVNNRKMHLIHLEDSSLAYLEIPKNASTSVKSEFLRICDPDVYDVLKSEPTFRYHQYFGRQPKFWLSSREVKQFPGYKFTIIRDPIERFYSAFSNRIAGKKEHLSTRRSKAILRKAGLSFEPSINEFAESFEIYASVNAQVRHHFRPQSDFIIDRSLVDGVFLMTQMEELVKTVNARTGLELHMPRKNASHRHGNTLDQLAIKKLRSYYNSDYEMFPELTQH